MTVYVCYEYVEYEGCSEPIEVFATRELAEAYCTSKNNAMDPASTGPNDRYEWVKLPLRRVAKKS